jgi:hypothetical protein
MFWNTDKTPDQVEAISEDLKDFNIIFGEAPVKELTNWIDKKTFKPTKE